MTENPAYDTPSIGEGWRIASVVPNGEGFEDVLPDAVEMAEARQVDAWMEAGIKICWFGFRPCDCQDLPPEMQCLPTRLGASSAR